MVVRVHLCQFLLQSLSKMTDCSKCPSCGTAPCYLPLVGSEAECSNAGCKNYSSELYPISVKAPKTVEDCGPDDTACVGCSCEYVGGADADDAMEPKAGNVPVYLWSTYHHDFGD